MEVKRFLQGSFLAVILFGFALLTSACGGGKTSLSSPNLANLQPPAGDGRSIEVTWPTALPVDTLQPWEELDADGYVIPPEKGEGHAASAINLDSDFTPGRERYSEAGDVTDLDEASRFASGAAGAQQVSYAIYEVAMASAQPGAVSADVNLRLRDDMTPSAYWLGFSDYGNNTYVWRGPFSDGRIRLSVPPGDYTSPLGSFFVCVVAYDGADFDLVGLGVNPRDDTDTDPPPQPSGPIVTPLLDGLLVEWLPVVASDLAGYRLYWSDNVFYAPDDLGVESVNYLQGDSLRHHLTGVTGMVYVRLTAVDISGNESLMSPVVNLGSGSDPAPVIELATDVVSGPRGIPATLTVSGAATYDFDLDGDGDFDDLVGDPGGTASVNTDAPGIIRPAVRGVDGGGGIAFAAVSLIIHLNSRPVAVAHATPASGLVPLAVTFTGEGFDDDGTIDEYAWDFEGDGTYDVMVQNPPPHTYTIAGMYNAKFRVTDDGGSFDVDTLAIDAQADPANLPPVITGMGANPAYGMPGTAVDFSATATDPDGSIDAWDWDFENDGTYDVSEQNPSYQFDVEGFYNVKLRVTDDDGSTAVGYVGVTIESDPGNLPPVITEAMADPDEGTPPLTVSLTGDASDPDGSIAEYAWDFENDGTFDFTSDTLGDIGTEYSSEGYYTACFQVTDDDDATTRTYLGISVSGAYNQPPVAGLTADETVFYLDESGTASLEFDASSSYDPEGGALTYYFDPEGDGSYVNNGTDPTYDHEYSETGTYMAKLKVEDTDNDCDYDSCLISVYRFGSVTVDSAGTVGQYTSLAVVKGHPAVAYYDTTNTGLKYVRATDASGSAWAPPVFADNSGAVGAYPSLIVVEGRPAISYYDGTNTALKFVRAEDDTGNTWGVALTLDDTGLVGGYSSLAIVSSNPAVSYYDAPNTALKYVRSNTSTGSSWGTPVIADDSAAVGQYTSLYVVNGNPAISYYDATNGDLKYVRAANANGSTWGTPVAVDITDDVGKYTSLAVVDGNPAISYFDDDPNYDLMYVRATDVNGDNWGAPVSPDSAGSKGYHPSLVVIDGRPAISYRASAGGDLRFVWATDATGTSWGTPLIPDTAGNTGGYTSLAIVNGRPGISYYDYDNNDLKFTIPRL